ncbi:MAG TPA: hypothetical protein DIU35_17905 [Candidatus Latescibacteria bacterium]|nr:hypothetical protein [Candidatus Latescibacterota bacterium]
MLNQRISGLGQNDAITQGRLADFESQSGRNRAQLEEDLNRLGILTTGGDTADQLQEFVTGMERGRQQIIGEGQARQERAFQDALGLLQSRRQDLGLQLGSEQTDRDLALRQVLGLGGLQQDESQFGRDLALRQELGRGGLGLQRDDLALRSELGRGRLGLDEELGRGRLGLEGRDLDLRTELGRGQLGVSRDDLALRSELGRGQLGLGRDRLGLDRELGQGRLGLGRDQLSLDEELGRLRSDLGFQQLGLGREQLGAQVARDQAADARAADQLGLGYDQLGAQIARDRAADARRAEEIGISRGDQAIQRREAGDKRLGKALGGLGGMAERVAGLLPGGGIASKVLKIFSDEALKDELRPVPEDQLLETLKSVPVQTWKYKGENEYHIGPTAQDFSKLGFDTGDRPRTIDMADYIGVALGAVKALDAKILAEKEHKWFEG